MTSALLFYLANWLAAKGLNDLALSCYRRVLRGGGRKAGEAAFRMARVMLASGKSLGARRFCEQHIAAAVPPDARIWCCLGIAHRQLGEMDAAKAAYLRATELAPRYVPGWSNLGELHLAQGQAENALPLIDRALSLNPKHHESLNNRVAALIELGRLAEAELAVKAALKSQPGAAALHANLGHVLLQTGQAMKAFAAYKRALECDPDCSEAHLGIAVVNGEMAHLAVAYKYLERQIKLRGKTMGRLASLALAQKTVGHLSKAEATCREILASQPLHMGALFTLAGCLSARADHRGAITLLDQLRVTESGNKAVHSAVAFDSTYLSDVSGDEVFELHRAWASSFEQVVEQPLAAHGTHAQSDRRLNIGYVSGDFGTHPVGYLVQDVLQNHDQDKFKIHCYSMMRGSDPITEAIRAAADKWVDVLFMNDEELAAAIRADKIDILIDLSGHTAYHRLTAFVLRPAPIQVTWIGYFHSTGLDSIDYYITDPHTSPVGCNQRFSEVPVCLPHTRFCYSPPAYAPPVAPSPCLRNRHVTFGSFNRSEKMVEPVVALWAQILNAVPGSRLLLKSANFADKGARNYFSGRFHKYGIDRKRLEFRRSTPHPVMLAEYSEVDIALDPFPFSGGMTTLEALWMGVPVITLVGDSVVSRQGYSALANIGLSEQLAFSSRDDYVTAAIELASDPVKLDELRRGIRTRIEASPIRDAPQFARDLEALYRSMWDAHCRGEKLPSALA